MKRITTIYIGLIIFLSLILHLVLVASSWAQGYTIRDNKLVIWEREDWEAWRFPRGAVEIVPYKEVKPRLMRTDMDVVADASLFVHRVEKDFRGEFPYRLPYPTRIDSIMGLMNIQGGIKNVGSNPEDGPNILDGDPHTFWGPDPTDDLEDWWIEVDLGRLVSATEIVLRFVEEAEGDVFETFKVSTSRGEAAYVGARFLEWRQIFRSRIPDPVRRVYEIPLEPTAKGKYEGEGDEIQYIRIQATDGADKGKEVSRREYEAFPPEMKGPVEYYKRTLLGEERVISAEGYRALYPEEKGPIRYYRIPLPRLAEIEVWGIGDNASVGAVQRGGSVQTTGTYFSLRGSASIDGAYPTHSLVQRFREGDGLLIDLGATFWVDRTRTIMAQRERNWKQYIPSYKIKGSDGTRTSDGDLVWQTLSPESRETMEAGTVLERVEDLFDPHKIRYFMLEFFTNVFILSEFQAYGEGYIPGVTLTSPIIELALDRAMSYIHWRGTAPEGTRVEIRTRTGDELKETVRYYDVDGNPVTERVWRRLPTLFRIPPQVELVPGDDWSLWSAPYAHSGDLVASPSPRRYLQLEARLLSDDPKRHSSIERVEVDLFTPLVQEAIGEIAPVRTKRPGVSSPFSIFIRMKHLPRNVGFDGLLLTCPDRVEMKLVGIHRGREEDFGTGQEEEMHGVEVLKATTDSIQVGFPEVLRPLGWDLLEIQFDAAIFLKGTPFEVFLTNSSMPDSPQRVIPGDATSLFEGRGMRVTVPVDRGVIGDVSVSPNPFTPNGDGINDHASIQFSIFNADVDKLLDVVVYDLGGGVVRRLSDRRRDISGRHTVSWDGREDSGRKASPGIYLVRIRVDADSDGAERTAACRLVSMVY